LTVNSKHHIVHSSSDNVNNTLEALNFLEEEHIHWNIFASICQALWSFQSLKSIFNVQFIEVGRKILDKFLLKFVFNFLLA